MDVWIVMKGLQDWPSGIVEDVFTDEAAARSFAIDLSLKQPAGPQPTTMHDDEDGSLVITNGLIWIKALRKTAKDSFEIPG